MAAAIGESSRCDGKLPAFVCFLIASDYCSMARWANSWYVGRLTSVGQLIYVCIKHVVALILKVRSLYEY